MPFNPAEPFSIDFGDRDAEGQSDQFDPGQPFGLEPVEGSTAPTLLDKVRNPFRAFGRSAYGLPASMLEGVAVLAKKLDTTLPEPLQSYEGKAARELATFRAGQAIREFAESQAPSHPELTESFLLEKLPAGLGSFASFLVGGLAGRALKLGTLAVPATMGASAGASEAYTDASLNTDEETALAAGMLGMIPGSLEAVPILGALTRFDRTPGKTASRRVMQVLASGAVGGLEEAIQESMSQGVQNLIAQQLWDHDRELSQGLMESATVGGATGLIANSLLTALGARKARGPMQPGRSAEEATLDYVDPLEPGSRPGEIVLSTGDPNQQITGETITLESQQGRVAPATSKGTQEALPVEMFDRIKQRHLDEGATEQEATERATRATTPIELFDLTEPIFDPVAGVELPAGSTVARATIERSGFTIPVQASQLLTEIMDANPNADRAATEQLLEGKEYVRVDVPVGEVGRPFGVAGREAVDRYAGQPAETAPPITLSSDLRPIDGKHRLAAAVKRGDATISAYVPVDMANQFAPAQAQPAAPATPAATQPDQGGPAEAQQPAPLERSPAALGILPEGASRIWDAILRVFVPPRGGKPRDIRIEHGRKAPRFHDYETQKAMATTPHGMAKVPVVGFVADPRARVHTPQQRSLIARAFSIHQGKTFAAMWAAIQGRARPFLAADPNTGKIKLANGKSGYMADVFEAELREPGSQPLTTNQRRWLNEEYLPLLRERIADMQAEGVKGYVDDAGNAIEISETYFPRPAVGKRAVGTEGGGGSRPGSRQFFQKSRLYKSEQEGATSEDGIIYDPNGVSRVARFLQGTYRAIADTRLAKDPALGGETVDQRLNDLKATHAERLALLDGAELAEAEAQLAIEAAHPVWGRENFVNVGPAFHGRIYPVETAKAIERAFAAESAAWVSAAANITAASKALTAVGDLSQFFIQGIGLLGRHPVRWAQASANTLRALRDPQIMADILARPEMRRAADQFTQSGGTLFQLQDFLEGAKTGAFATRIPLVGPVIGRLGAGYGVFIDMGKLYLWQAHGATAPRSSWPKLAETIENSMYMGRMEAIGKSPQGALAERLAFFAPAYYRASGGLIASALSRDVGSSLSRQIIGGTMASTAVFFYGLAQLLGLDDEDILERLNPLKGKFMMVPVELPDGRAIEVGVGNILLQMGRLGFKAFDFHVNGKAIKEGSENNPYLQFLRARGAFLPSIAHDIVLGRDYLGNPITPSQVLARKFVPFAWQSMFPHESEATYQQRAADASLTFFGFRSYPESEYAAQFRKMNERAREQHGAPFDQISLKDRAGLMVEFKRSDQWQRRDITARDMERFFAAAEDRRVRLEEDIDSSKVRRLESMGLRVGAWRATIRVSGQDVPLTDSEENRYHELLVEAYNENIDRVPKRILDRPLVDREEFWSRMQTDIRALARARLVREIDPRSE